MPPIEFLAERREAGKTIASVLRARFDLPWSLAKRLIENGHVRVAGFACTDPGHRVKAKNRVWIREGVIENKAEKKQQYSRDAKRSAPPRKEQLRKKPKPIDTAVPGVEIVYTDDAVVVANKPAGLTTMRHAEEAEEFGPRGKAYLPKTLADHLPSLLGSPKAKLLPVHRIDRDTSGLVVFARTPAAAANLAKQFRKHTVDRRYLALVRGTPPEGRTESTFVGDRGDGRRGSGDGPDGKRAVTHVKVLERFPKFALVECRLETGRTHQVRIHLGEASAPLCGETVYDRPLHGKPLPDGSGATRPMLHAGRLGFVHPETGDAMSWEIPPPADFAALLQKLRSTGRV